MKKLLFPNCTLEIKAFPIINLNFFPNCSAYGACSLLCATEDFKFTCTQEAKEGVEKEIKLTPLVGK